MLEVILYTFAVIILTLAIVGYTVWRVGGSALREIIEALLNIK